MSLDTSHEFKIEEKIAAIKRTMQQLGSSIKDAPTEPHRLLKASHSMEDLQDYDLLTSPVEEPREDLVPPLYASIKQSVDLTKGMAGKSPEVWELNVLLDYEKDKVAALESRLKAKEMTIAQLSAESQKALATAQAYRSEAVSLRETLEQERTKQQRETLRADQEIRLLQDRVDKEQTDWETVQAKYKALQEYVAALEARNEVEDLAARVRDLENERIALITESAQTTQRVQSQERELELVKQALDAARNSAAGADKSLSVKEQELVHYQREKVSLLKEIDSLQAKIQRQSDLDDVSYLKEENKRLVRELKSARGGEGTLAREKEELLGEIRTLRLEKARGRSQSAERFERPCTKRGKTKRSKSQGRKPSHPNLAGGTTRRTPTPALLTQLQEIFEVTEVEQLLPTCLERLREMGELRKFSGNLAVLIRDCSPPDSFARQPSHRQMWKWVKRLVEEYMHIRKSEGEEMRQLKGLLGVRSNSDLLRTVTRHTAELQSLQTLLEKLRLVLGLSPRVELEAIDQALSSMLA